MTTAPLCHYVCPLAPCSLPLFPSPHLTRPPHLNSRPPHTHKRRQAETNLTDVTVAKLIQWKALPRNQGGAWDVAGATEVKVTARIENAAAAAPVSVAPQGAVTPQGAGSDYAVALVPFVTTSADALTVLVSYYVAGTYVPDGAADPLAFRAPCYGARKGRGANDVSAALLPMLWQLAPCCPLSLQSLPPAHCPCAAPPHNHGQHARAHTHTHLAFVINTPTHTNTHNACTTYTCRCVGHL